MNRPLFLNMVGAAAVAQGSPLTTSPRPARILVLGDSVTRGQGLRDRDKMHNVLARKIYQASGVAPYVAHYAHSGAVIGVNATAEHQQPWWPREIPPHDTILQQCETAYTDEINNRRPRA